MAKKELSPVLAALLLVGGIAAIAVISSGNFTGGAVGGQLPTQVGPCEQQLIQCVKNASSEMRQCIKDCPRNDLACKRECVQEHRDDVRACVNTYLTCTGNAPGGGGGGLPTGGGGGLPT